MPDTKAGREKKGKNKRAQLRQQLTERELASLDGEDTEEPRMYAADGDEELLADEPPGDG